MASKGGGKGKGSVNCNVQGLPNSSIDGLPHAGVAVFRESADQAVEFCEKLREAMAPFPAGGVRFENVDVSNVTWPLMTFSILLDVLQEKAATTQRLKAFKCGLDDECINCIASWLESVRAEELPSEIHLSHNSITQKGLEVLFTTIETKRAQLSRHAMPIWFRVENNQVDVEPNSAYMKTLLAAGRVVLVTRIGDRMPSSAVVAMPDFKKAWTGQASSQTQQPVRMALPAGGGQVAGNYNTSGSWPGGWGMGATISVGVGPTMPQAGGAVTQGGNWWDHTPRTVWPPTAGASSAWGRQGSVTPASWGVTATQATSAWGQQPQQHQQQQQQQQQQRFSAAADRSRTPTVRKAQEPKLPPNWEKQWSDEYQIPYYWNNVTGDSLWEPPQD